MDKQTAEHPINHGEHAANDGPQIDWARYHANTPKLTLRGHHERQNRKTDKTDCAA